MSDEIKEFRISNEAIDDPAELSQRIADEGYLFFKRLQNPDKLIGLRREMMTAIQRSGWLIAGTDPMDGRIKVSGPVCNSSRAEPCREFEPYIDLMKHNSSDIDAMCGKISDAHWPHWPYCLKP